MNTTQVQIKINLSKRLNDLITTKAMQFGMSVTQFVKYLIVKDIENDEYHIFQMSKRTEQKIQEAMDDYHAEKVIKVDNVSEFFKNL